MALAALQVHAQEQPADVARQDVRVSLAVEQEPGRGAGGRVGPVGGQDLADEHVIRPVLGERRAEELAPGARGDVDVGPALHQHDVEDLLHPPGEGRRSRAGGRSGPSACRARGRPGTPGPRPPSGSSRRGPARRAGGTRRRWPVRRAPGPAVAWPARASISRSIRSCRGTGASAAGGRRLRRGGRGRGLRFRRRRPWPIRLLAGDGLHAGRRSPAHTTRPPPRGRPRPASPVVSLSDPVARSRAAPSHPVRAVPGVASCS